MLVTGTPGGSRIITTVLQVILNVIDFGMNVADAVAAPRIHHQWLPDELRVERGFSADTCAPAGARPQGRSSAPPRLGQFDLVTPGGLVGAADPSVRGSRAAGY